jgi:TonB family protein
MKSINMAAACVLLALSSLAPAQTPDEAKPAEKPPHKVPSGIAYGYKIHNVAPEYPLVARRAKLQGDVILMAMIDTTGKVTTVKVLQGHPLLANSAIKAVQQWKYRPFLLKGEAVPVETTVTVHFHL